eukprot:g7420.t1
MHFRGQTGLSLFNVASSVVSSVRGGADELMSSLKDTSWSTEFVNFSKAVQNETEQALKNLESIPEKAEEILPGMTSVSNKFQQLVGDAKQLFNHARGSPHTDTTSTRTHEDPTHTNKTTPNTKYSRFESDVIVMQQDVNTYCTDPDDVDEFAKWSVSFTLEEYVDEIETLMLENHTVMEMHNKFVPLVLQNTVFWSRYFYQFWKLQKKHDQLQQLAERAQKMHEEEQELHWDEEGVTHADQKEQETPEETPEDDSDWNIVDPPTIQPTEKSEKEQKSEEEIDEDWGSWE